MSKSTKNKKNERLYITNEMSCIKLDILEEWQSPLKVVYRKVGLREKVVQRFISVDSLEDAPHLVGWSLYHYTYNNPINYIDPDGA